MIKYGLPVTVTSQSSRSYYNTTGDGCLKGGLTGLAHLLQQQHIAPAGQHAPDTQHGPYLSLVHCGLPRAWTAADPLTCSLLLPCCASLQGRTLLELARAFYSDAAAYQMVFAFNHQPDKFDFQQLCRELGISTAGRPSPPEQGPPQAH